MTRAWLRPAERTVEIIRYPGLDGFAVVTTYSGGRWDGYTCTHYCERYRDAVREYNNAVRSTWRG